MLLKTAIITGATGFLGYALLTELVQNGIRVCVLCRKGSKRRSRLDDFDNIDIVDCELSRADEVVLSEKYDAFYHLAWEGERDDFEEQYRNVDINVKCLKLAAKSGCKRFICTGSQAEYGSVMELITEETPLNPKTAYGACKAAAFYLTRDLASGLGIEHTWARPFSVYGSHDNPNSLLPRMIAALAAGRDFALATDGSHTWNYLHETDAARALRLLGERGVSDTVFNLAGNENLPLRAYVERARDAINPEAVVTFGAEKSDVNLNVSIKKIKQAIGWEPKIAFSKESFLWR